MKLARGYRSPLNRALDKIRRQSGDLKRLTAEAADAAKWIAAADAEMDRMRDEAALAISLAKADAARLRCMCVELDHLSLVILSAVRQQDPRNYEAVAALIQDNRAALAKEATHGQ